MLDERDDLGLRRRRYVVAALGVGLLAAAGALALSMLADDPRSTGGFDHAEWDEPGLAPVAHIPGLPESPGTLTAALQTPSGAVLVSVHPDGRVAVEALDEEVSWLDAKAAFDAWAASKGLAQASYEGLRVTEGGRLVDA